MKTATVSALTLALAVTFAGTALAQNGLPSSKATADVSTLVTCKMSTATNNDASFQLPASCTDIYTGATVDTTGGWINIMSKSVKLSNSQSLFVSPSLVSGLYTRTRTKTSDGSTSTAQAEGAVYLRAVLTPADGGDDIIAAPLNLCAQSVFGCSNAPGSWGVILDSRIQTLTQDITACTVLIDGGGSGTCDFTSTIDFVLQTASANTFNFIFPNVGQGTYTLKIYAAVGSGATIIEGSGSAVGAAAFGLGSVTAEAVRLVHDFEF
jgi:hypothetical protein